MSGLGNLRACAAVVAAALMFAGCGGDDNADAGDETADYMVEVVRADFPEPNGRAARGSIAVRVTDKPPKARVDPRTGKVIRETMAQEG